MILLNTLDEWIYFLKNEEIKTDFKAKGLNEAKEVLDVLNLIQQREKFMREKRRIEDIKSPYSIRQRKRGGERDKKRRKKKGY